MKATRKLLAALLTLVMAAALVTAPAAAVEGDDSGTDTAATTGTITIKNAVPGETYKIYQIFTLSYYNGSAYAYHIDKTSSWWNFVKPAEDGEAAGAGAAYVTVDNDGYVTWTTREDTDTNTEEYRAAFAKAALVYAQENNVTATATKKASAGTDPTTVTFDNLSFGYYLVDSSLGTLAILNSTAPDFTQNDKNLVPAIAKQVLDTHGNSQDQPQYKNANTANIGEEVTFQTTITARAGALSYKLHDEMTSGFTFKEIQSVQYVAVDTYDNDTKTYKYKTAASVDNTKYTITLASSTETSTLDDNCDFEITFEQTFLDTLKSGDKIEVTYTATLNENAVVGGTNNGTTTTNVNTAKLTYGAAGKLEAATQTDTYSFDLVKTTTNNTVLSGAKFELYDAQTNGNKIDLVKEDDGNYRLATAAEQAKDGFTSAVIEAGKVTIKGLGNGTYYLEETEAPAGYNKLGSRVEVTISSQNLTATMNGTTYTGGIQVENKTGSELPSTGGVGTTVFYVAGGILVTAAVVLLVVRKRMDEE